jgi:hypothetical protein
LSETIKPYLLTLKVSESSGEVRLETILEQMEKEFKGITFGIKPKEKRLVPLEIILDISINVGAGFGTAALIKLLERLWRELKKNKLAPQTYGLDAVQSFAQRYLQSIGVKDFNILKRQDKGPYVQFLFGDKRNCKHIIAVTTFDLKILSYERKEGV